MTSSAPRKNPARFRRRASAVVAGAIVLALAVSGCATFFTGPQASPTVSSTSTPTGENVDAALQPFYSQVIEWSDCDGGMQCATVMAPLDWSDPAAGTVDLAVVRQPARGGARLGSLLVNPGGPGASGYDFVKDSVGFATSKELQAQYDVVGFDPRGVGRSSKVTCLDNAGMDSYIYDILPGKRGSGRWIQEYTASSKTFADACGANSGDLLQHVDTVSAARDMDLMRAVLGDTKLNYLGYSYGTFLGSTYADLYPTHIGRMVLDGALDPTSSGFDVSLGQAVGFENAMRAYMADCLTRSTCPFTGTVDEGMARIAQLLAEVDSTPIATADGRELGSSTLITAIVYPLYDATAWTYLSTMFAEVMAGKSDLAMQFADAYNGRGADGTYKDNSTEAFMAINCLDYPVTTDAATIAAQNAQLVAEAPVIGPYWTYGDIGCEVWPDQSTRTPHAVTAEGAPPILVVGTTGDPATPYKWAQALAGQLSTGQLITYVGEGHTAYGSSSCVKGIVDTYLLTGSSPASDPRCTQ
jgi:pimeloyl-ACP methyl ester carboxylesterase